jgi:cytoskeletal protein CcmA (bactofilin family)
MKFKSEGRQSDLNGILDSGSHLQGELRFESSFRIDGKLTGTVESAGDLIVGESGEVEGEIRVGQIFVSGRVHGTVRAAAKVQIAPGGKVFADLHTPKLVIEDGALYEGHCSMTRDAAKAAVPGPKLVTSKVAVREA